MLTSTSHIDSTNQGVKGEQLDYGFRFKTEADDNKSLSDTVNPDTIAGSESIAPSRQEIIQLEAGEYASAARHPKPFVKLTPWRLLNTIFLIVTGIGKAFSAVLLLIVALTAVVAVKSPTAILRILRMLVDGEFQIFNWISLPTQIPPIFAFDDWKLRWPENCTYLTKPLLAEFFVCLSFSAFFTLLNPYGFLAEVFTGVGMNYTIKVPPYVVALALFTAVSTYVFLGLNQDGDT